MAAKANVPQKPNTTSAGGQRTQKDRGADRIAGMKLTMRGAGGYKMTIWLPDKTFERFATPHSADAR